MRISLETLVMSNCVRYERLNQLIQEAFAGSNASELNIYIDLYSIIKSLYSQNHITEVHDYREIVSCVINLCGHYREYFRKYLQVSTKIFLVFSNNCSDINRKLVSGYNNTMHTSIQANNTTTTFINDNMDLLSILCPYLPDIFFIRTSYETGVVMSRIIEDQYELGNTSPNLIISKDPYNIQLCTLYPETAYMRPRKVKGEDTSLIIRPIRDDISLVQFWNHYVDINGWKRDEIIIPPNKLSLVMALSGVPSRNIKSIFNTKKAKSIILKTLDGAVGTVHSLFESNPEISVKVAESVIESRFKAIDIRFQRSIFDDSIEYKMIKYKNITDSESVKQINDHYFSNNPLDIERL